MSSQGPSSVPLDAAACQDPTAKQHLLKAQQQSELKRDEVHDLLVKRVEYGLLLSGAPPHRPTGARTRPCCV